MEINEFGAVVDEWGNELGYCNSCGEEAEMYTECCEDGEVIAYEVDEDGNVVAVD